MSSTASVAGLDLEDVPIPLLAVALPDGVIVASNAAFRTMLGGDPGAGTSLVELLVDADPVMIAAAMATGLDSAWLPTRLRRLDGETRPVDLVPGAPRPVGRQVVSVVAVQDAAGVDIFDDLVLRAHDILGEGVLVGDGQRLLFANESACSLYGRSLEDLRAVGSVFELLVPDERIRISELVAHLVAMGSALPERYETTIARPDGTTIDVEMSVKAAVGGDRVRTVSILRDISERRAATLALTRLALEDPLTGLPNRRLLLERVGQAVARSRRLPTIDALLFVDLDRFKAVNDQAGHAVGDVVLQRVGERLVGQVRPGDTAARLGGDEFVVLAEDLPDGAAVDDLASRLAGAIAEPMVIDGRTWQISASIGVTLFGDDADLDADSLLGAADAAMYRAKERR